MANSSSARSFWPSLVEESGQICEERSCHITTPSGDSDGDVTFLLADGMDD